MKILSPEGISNYDKYTFYFTYSYRGESVPLDRLNGNVVLDVNGEFYSLRDASSRELVVCVIGGLNKHVFAKNTKPAIPFYITRLQKVALYNLIRMISVYSEEAELEAENEELQILLDSLYTNFTG